MESVLDFPKEITLLKKYTMKNLNIIKSVTELLTASDLNDVKKYNEIKDLLNVNF